jgi:hypothetical protein
VQRRESVLCDRREQKTDDDASLRRFHEDGSSGESQKWKLDYRHRAEEPRRRREIVDPSKS